MSESFDSASKDQKEAIQQIIYKGYLAGVYKYLKGVSSLIFFDAKLENGNDIEAINKEVERVMDVVRLNAELIHKLTEGNFQGKDSILNFTAPNPETYREKDKMELADRLHDSLYNIRVRSELVIRAVSLSMPKKLNYLIDSYERPSEIKPRDISIYITDKDVHVDKKPKSTANKLKLDLNQSMFIETKPNPKPVSAASASHYSEYTKVMDLYSALKEEQLDKRGIENILIYFFIENQVHIKTVIGHCIQSIIKGLRPEKPAQDEILRNFFKQSYVFAYISFLSSLLNAYPPAKDVFYCMVCDKPNSNQEDNVKKILSIKDEKWSLYSKESEEVMNYGYVLMSCFKLFLQFKSFIGPEFESNWSYFMVLSDFFKNCCENNAIFFKEYFSTFKPSIPKAINGVDIESGANPRNWDFLFDSYVRLESFQNTSLTWLKTSRSVESFDRPELFRMCIRNFELISEMVNGPCNVNQRRIYRYRTDIWMGLVVRIIDDVNSEFYKYKESIIDYIMGLTEGEGYVDLGDKAIENGGGSKDEYLTTKFFASNFTPKLIYDTMNTLLKKLALFQKFKKNQSLRTSIMYTIAEKEIKLVKKQNGGKISQEDQNYIYDKYGIPKTFFSSGKKLDPKDFPVVTDEMCNEYKFTSYKELMSMYLSEEDFSGHQIIKIAMKLYSFLERLADKNVSSAFNLFVSEKKNELYTHYGDEVDLDDRATKLLSSRPNKTTKPLTEDLVLFMFILKISRRIEITVKLPNMEEPINKLVYFRRIPETFFLEDKVKKRFMDRV